jgi:regulator of protease activity HflC (stomatin/prohibitin superfamily)
MEQVLLRNVLLPDQITKAINDKIAADQEAQKMMFVLQKEKQEAERKRIEAEGQAKAQQIVSASLTPQIIEYQRIQALRAIGDKGNLIITPMGGATPMINIAGRK